MSTTDALADPLSQALALLLTEPLIEMYAVLWRLGVVEIVETRRASSGLRARSAVLVRMYAYRLRSA
jgi:hypothetical protein